MTTTPNIVQPTTYEEALLQEAILAHNQLSDITTEEWLVVTTEDLPDSNPRLADAVQAIRHNIMFNAIRCKPGNERPVALYGLKRTISSLTQ